MQTKPSIVLANNNEVHTVATPFLEEMITSVENKSIHSLLVAVCSSTSISYFIFSLNHVIRLSFPIQSLELSFKTILFTKERILE